MGKGEEVWDRLQHGTDPRLRSFIVNSLKPLGADPKLIATEFGRINDPVRRGSPRLSNKMEDRLFDRDASMRRALILALGTYSDDLSETMRAPLIADLLGLYRDDPDAGIHGAAEWTLRRWKQEEKLRTIDAAWKVGKDRGERQRLVHQQAGPDILRD